MKEEGWVFDFWVCVVNLFVKIIVALPLVDLHTLTCS